MHGKSDPDSFGEFLELMLSDIGQCREMRRTMDLIQRRLDPNATWSLMSGIPVLSYSDLVAGEARALSLYGLDVG